MVDPASPRTAYPADRPWALHAWDVDTNTCWRKRSLILAVDVCASFDKG